MTKKLVLLLLVTALGPAAVKVAVTVALTNLNCTLVVNSWPIVHAVCTTTGTNPKTSVIDLRPFPGGLALGAITPDKNTNAVTFTILYPDSNTLNWTATDGTVIKQGQF